MTAYQTQRLANNALVVFGNEVEQQIYYLLRYISHGSSIVAYQFEYNPVNNIVLDKNIIESPFLASCRVQIGCRFGNAAWKILTQQTFFPHSW
jgi:hypothetical protein